MLCTERLPGLFLEDCRYIATVCTDLAVQQKGRDASPRHPLFYISEKFRVPLRGERPERLTVARHQSHDLVGHLSKVQQCFVHLCL